jgi:hypothetical protein
MITGLQCKEYEGKLRELKLTTLQEQRYQANMLQMYKDRCEQQDGDRWFRPPPAAACTCPNANQQNVQPNHVKIRRNAFSVRAGDLWNAIPAQIKSVPTSSSFKHAYAKFREPMI